MALLVLGNLLKSDYCKIKGIGPVHAFQCLSKFTTLEDVSAMFQGLKWSEQRITEATSCLLCGVASFLLQPVVRFSFESGVDSGASFSFAVERNLSARFPLL